MGRIRSMRWRVAGIGLIAAATLIATSSVATAANVLGPVKKAKGTPITVGFSNDGTTAAQSTFGEIQAAEAAADYVNQHLNGINGHPIVLDVCMNDETTSGATQCANKWIADKVPVVLVGTTGVGAPLAAGVLGANIPMLWDGTTEPSALTSPESYVLANGLAIAFGAPAAIGQHDHYTQAAFIVEASPSALAPQEAIGVPVFKAAGQTLNAVGVPAGTADMTPQVAAMLQKKPQLIEILGTSNFCVSAIKAMKTLGFHGTTVITPSCLGPGVAKSIPGGLAGIVEVTPAVTRTSDPEVQLLNAAMREYERSVPLSNGLLAVGWGSVLGFARAMKGLTTFPATPAAVNTAFLTMAPAQLPLGVEGQTFQCNRKVMAIAGGICSAGSIVITLNKSGSAAKEVSVNPNALLTKALG